MKRVPVEDSVGLVLGHDLTRIVPGREKGPAFRRGQVIRLEDVPLLRDMGKEHVYVGEPVAGEVHEDEAAVRLARAVAGKGVELAGPREGRVNLVAVGEGLLRVRVAALHRLNGLGQLVVATLPGDRLVKGGEVVAGVRVLPLAVREEHLRRAERLGEGAGGLVEVESLPRRRVGVVVTGSEVYRGRIPDGFGPVVRGKVEALGSEVMGELRVPDDPAELAAAIRLLVAGGAELVVCTGGMSVDPDDRTPAGIRLAGAEVVVQGVPVLPGAMFMLAYLGRIAVVGLPGCAMYDRVTVFDLVLPRLLLGERLGRRYFARLGYGGLCRHCAECSYPACSFGLG